MNPFIVEKARIQEIPVKGNVRFFIKRDDQIHPKISGNKFWKLFYPLQRYLMQLPNDPRIITFGGAFSNHISAVSYAGKISEIKTLGIIRGEELASQTCLNPTLNFATKNGMDLRFVSREIYRDKKLLSKILKKEFPNALILPEGGTSESAVRGIQNMMGNHTKEFNYLCSAVGTGGTLAGISKYCEKHQQVIGFKVVKDSTLENIILNLSGKRNFILKEPSERYGKITDENVRFINEFYQQFAIPLDPIYTGKMIQKLMLMIKNNEFLQGSKILAFHTGGLQGIEGANQMLKKQNRTLINFVLK